MQISEKLIFVWLNYWESHFLSLLYRVKHSGYEITYILIWSSQALPFGLKVAGKVGMLIHNQPTGPNLSPTVYEKLLVISQIKYFTFVWCLVCCWSFWPVSVGLWQILHFSLVKVNKSDFVQKCLALIRKMLVNMSSCEKLFVNSKPALRSITLSPCAALSTIMFYITSWWHICLDNQD